MLAHGACHKKYGMKNEEHGQAHTGLLPLRWHRLPTKSMIAWQAPSSYPGRLGRYLAHQRFSVFTC